MKTSLHSLDGLTDACMLCLPVRVAPHPLQVDLVKVSLFGQPDIPGSQVSVSVPLFLLSTCVVVAGKSLTQ
jgi:hypothetical protein